MDMDRPLARVQARRAPRRFLVDAPAIVRKNVVDIIEIKTAAPLDYDVIFRQPSEPRGGASYCLDFGNAGEQGCHFYLPGDEMRAYRERNRRHRVAWNELPAATQRAIVAYLESE